MLLRRGESMLPMNSRTDGGGAAQAGGSGNSGNSGGAAQAGGSGNSGNSSGAAQK